MNPKSLIFRTLGPALVILASLDLTLSQGVPPLSLSESSENGLALRIGINDFHVRDHYLSPFSYQGRLFSSSLSYQLKLEHTRHAVDFGFSTGHTESDAQSQEATQYVGGASYAFMVSLHTWDVAERQLELFVGTGLSTFFATTDIVTPESITWYGPTDKTWYWSHNLDVHLVGEMCLADRQSVSATLSMPVFRLVSRPEVSHNFSTRNIQVRDNFLEAAKGGRSEFFWSNLDLFFQIEYRQRLNDHFDIRGTYSFAYSFSDWPLSMGMYMNNFLAGIVWLF
jgi:hypothetical protein